MKISLKWLSDYVDIAEFFAQPQELANKLTAGGLEVESIQDLSKQFENVVVGHILEKGQHPNADRLSLCQVTTGEGRVHQIVCGAQNHKQNDRVVVALPGAVLPGDFAIKKSKIRGVDSGGMLCSEKELGLKVESEGILILPQDAPIGQTFAAYMGYDDIVFELKVTPNRADCLSHFGLAREIACLLGREVKWPYESLKEAAFSTRSCVQLEVKTPDVCPRFTGRSIKDVKVAPSPEWLRKRLESVGLKSINNVVDVTNFVMMELGQPLHAYDVRELHGAKISVDRSQADETFVSLDGTEYKLTGDELMIRDAARAVGLAGIVGGKNSGVKDDTTEIFLECAYFSPSQVRRVARRFGIDTDASYRFSRGVNPEAVPLALNRAAQLIQKVAGGNIGAEPYDFYPQVLAAKQIEIGLSTLTDRLGYQADAKGFVDWMQRLGCEVRGASLLPSDTAPEGVDKDEIRWSIKPPLFRGDLTMDMDLVEEYARLHGYEHIPDHLPSTSVAPSEHQASYLLERKVRKILQSQGYHQAVNYAFLSAKYQNEILGDVETLKAFGLRAIPHAVALINPLNEELGVLRTSLIPGLIRNIAHNFRFAVERGQLFETGFAHEKSAEGYAQEARLGLALWGSRQGLWQKEQNALAVYELKSHLENFLLGMGYSRWKWINVNEVKSVPHFLHPGQCASLTVEGKQIGFIGSLHPLLQEELKIREGCALAELNLDRLTTALNRSPKFKPVSKQPTIDRDVAFLLPQTLPAADVEEVIRKTAGVLLQDAFAFDVFTGGNLAAGQRSVAFRLIFQDFNATLEDTRVNELRDQVVNAVCQKFTVSVR